MKRLIALIMCAVSLGAAAQIDWDFPYNPDGNADGYIGLSDMLDLLSVYGQQYSESFYGDSTGAILFVGEETAGGCLRASEQAGSKWRVMTPLDALKRDIAVANHFSESWDQESSVFFLYWVKDTDGDLLDGALYFRDQSENWVNTQAGGEGYPDGLMTYNTIIQSTNFSEQKDYWQPRECILVTEVYPEIEYHIVFEDLQSTVSDSLSNGWKLAGGSSGDSQAIWKYAE